MLSNLFKFRTKWQLFEDFARIDNELQKDFHVMIPHRIIQMLVLLNIILIK